MDTMGSPLVNCVEIKKRKNQAGNDYNLESLRRFSSLNPYASLVFEGVTYQIHGYCRKKISLRAF